MCVRNVVRNHVLAANVQLCILLKLSHKLQHGHIKIGRHAAAMLTGRVCKGNTSNSKKRVGEAATARCRFSVPDGVTALSDEARTAIGVSALATVTLSLVAS